jgi:hypothetical protein
MLFVAGYKQGIPAACCIEELLVIWVSASRARKGIEQRVCTESLELEEVEEHAYVGLGETEFWTLKLYKKIYKI